MRPGICGWDAFALAFTAIDVQPAGAYQRLVLPILQARPAVSASNLAAKSAWHASPHVRRTGIIVLAILAIVEGYLAICVRRNDFLFHRDLGQAFLEGDPYSQRWGWPPAYLAINEQFPLFAKWGCGDWYPLARVMLNAGPAMLPLYVSRALCYLLALAAWVACYRMWRQMAEARWPGAASLSFAAAVLSVLMLVPLVLRDLDECGLQAFLLFFLTAGAFALGKGRHTQAGFWLATAASYKVTPLLCLPFLLWKRQWRAAAAMTGFVGLWAVSPALFLGWQGMLEGQALWFHRVREVSAVREAYPSLLEFELPKPQNLSLQALLARYVEHYPEGHPLHLKHRAFVQFLALDQETAYRTVKALTLVFAALLAWRFRRRWGDGDTRADHAPEWAAVCMLCALLAPLCWKQHLVVILPAMFLTVRAALLAQPQSRVRWALIGMIAAIVLLARHAVGGREFSIVLLSYKIDTMAVLLLMALALTIAPRGPSATNSVKRLEPLMPRRAA